MSCLGLRVPRYRPEAGSSGAGLSGPATVPVLPAQLRRQALQVIPGQSLRSAGTVYENAWETMNAEPNCDLHGRRVWPCQAARDASSSLASTRQRSR